MRNTAAIYSRVSTVDKNQLVAVQEDILQEWLDRLGYDIVIYREEGVSGAKTSRPILDELMKAVRRREICAVAILHLDRLGRNLSHLLQIVAELEANGIRLLEHSHGVDTETPHGKMFLQMRGVFAEYERNILAERVKEGMDYAKRHGTNSKARWTAKRSPMR